MYRKGFKDGVRFAEAQGKQASAVNRPLLEQVEDTIGRDRGQPGAP